MCPNACGGNLGTPVFQIPECILGNSEAYGDGRRFSENCASHGDGSDMYELRVFFALVVSVEGVDEQTYERDSSFFLLTV